MDPEQLAENRRQLARFARQKSKRRLERPCRWYPGEVINPEDGQAFTDAGAWALIAQLLEDIEEQSVEIELLDSPKGKTGYVMKRDLPTGKLYIKVRHGHGSILGRSFHYSDYQTQS